METFGERLEFLIKTSDVKTITNFSKLSNFSAVAISNIVNEKSKPGLDFIMACVSVFPKLDLNWLISGSSIAEKLELENKHLKEVNTLYEKKLARIAKPSSDRMNPQLSFPGFGVEMVPAMR